MIQTHTITQLSYTIIIKMNIKIKKFNHLCQIRSWPISLFKPVLALKSNPSLEGKKKICVHSHCLIRRLIIFTTNLKKKSLNLVISKKKMIQTIYNIARWYNFHICGFFQIFFIEKSEKFCEKTHIQNNRNLFLSK